METQSPTHIENHEISLGTAPEFQIGEMVIYAMHGKCEITGVETRNIENKAIRFYKLEIRRSTLSRSPRPEPAIWVPVATAKDRGLRHMTTTDRVESILAILSSREYFLDANLPWSTAQTKLEELIRMEGAIGLAKATSFLFVLRNRQVVPTSEANKLYETVSKLLLRELSDATGETIRALEERINKSMRHKLRPDN